MPKQVWEYKRVTVWGTEGMQSDEQVSALLTLEYGQEGWELVHHQTG